MKRFAVLILIAMLVGVFSMGCTIKEDCDTEWAECMDNLPDNATYVQRQRCYTQYDKCLDKIPLSMVSPISVPSDVAVPGDTLTTTQN